MKMRWLWMICLVFLTFSLSGYAMNESFLKSTVLVNYSVPNGVSSATGFLMFRETGLNQGHVFLVTNVHAIPKEGSTRTISLRVMTKTRDTTAVTNLEIPVLGTDGKYLSSVKLNPKSFDVVAINITQYVIQAHVEAAFIPYNLLATTEKLSREGITVGDDIFLLGYPASICDPRNVYPVLRQGVIASVPTENFAFNEDLKKRYGLPEQIDGFLIDANVFPGSSGSLVILKQQATTIGLRGETVVSSAKKIPYVLGIVSASIPINDTALGSTQRMGLGIVYSYNAIRETIESFYMHEPRK